MSEQQDDDIERSFDRLNRSEEYREAKDGLGATRQGLHARRTYWPQLAKEIGDNRAESHDKALWRALKGMAIDDLAKTLVNIGLTICASDRLGIDRKTGNKTYIDIAEAIARNLIPQCRDRKLRIKIGDWAIERLRTLPIFALEGDILVLTTELGKVLGEFLVEEIVNKPLLSPMFEPPVPWTQVSKGGVPGYSISLVSGHHPKTEAAWRHAIARGKMDRVLAALNYLQSIPFVINEPVLAFMRSERRPPVQKPARGDMWKVRHHGPVQDQWKEYLSEMAREMELELAMYIRKRGRFWTPMHLEFRGRVIAIPNFHFGREDRVRGLFLFADGEPIGEDGLKWLKAHVAARADGVNWSIKPSKLHREQRISWTDENLPLLRKIGEVVLRGDDPETIEWALPSEDDERYQFLAACVELVQAIDTGPDFKTRLPLIFDCTNSGLQHLAEMRRDRTEGRWVNLCKPLEVSAINVTLREGDVIDAEAEGNKLSDFYSIMAVALWKRLQGESPALLDLLDSPLDRKIVKTPVMSYFYGATVRGMSDQIAEQVRARNKKRQRDRKPPIPIRQNLFLPYEANGILYGKFVDTFLPHKLAEILYALLEQQGAPKAAETRNHLKRLAELCTEYKKILRFDTLFGLWVINSYFYTDVERLIVSGSRGRRRDIMVATGDTDEINEDRAENAIAANFVHSADAALLHFVALAAEGEFLPMVSIHDCFATSAPFAATLNGIVRDCFIQLHQRFNWLNTIWQAARKILPKAVTMPPRLEVGDLDPNEVKSNPFFIN
jgi:Autographiviridae RNA polymerase